MPVLGRVNRYNQPWLVVCETHFCLPDGSLKEGQPSEDPLDMEPCKDQLRDQAHKLCDGDWSRVHRPRVHRGGRPPLDAVPGGQPGAAAGSQHVCPGPLPGLRSGRCLRPQGEGDVQSRRGVPVGRDALPRRRIGRGAARQAGGTEPSFRPRRDGEPCNSPCARRSSCWSTNGCDDRRRSASSAPTDEAPLPDEIDLPDDDGSYEITAEHLKREALVFVYRLLFCFYAEARGGELEILPIDEDTYRLGYSLESIRDLEQVPLTAANEDGSLLSRAPEAAVPADPRGFHPDEDGPQRQFEFQTDWSAPSPCGRSPPRCSRRTARRC